MKSPPGSATAQATDVLPIPPGPMIVTKRRLFNRPTMSLTASARPINRVSRVGAADAESTREACGWIGSGVSVVQTLATKTIAAPGNIHQVAGADFAIAKGLSHQCDLSSEVTLDDGSAWPDAGEQFVLGDDLARALDQDDQEVECAIADMNGRLSLEQQTRRGTQTKRPEPDLSVLGRGQLHVRFPRSAPCRRAQQRHLFA